MNENSKKIKMGVLGTSGHYALRISSSILQSNLIEPYALASRDNQKAAAYAQKHGFRKIYNSYDELLQDSDIDFVYCPLPNHLHFEYIKKSADAGKHILCEKPLCLNAEEAAKAAKYCAEKKVLLMEAFMYKFHPQWIRSAQIIKTGELGKIMAVQGFFSYNNTDGKNIRNIAEFGGGALLDIGCYTVSSARLFMEGEPLRAFAVIERDSVFKTDVFTTALLDFGDGRIASFTVSTQMFPHQIATAIGTRGTLSVKLPYNMYVDTPAEINVTTGIGTRTVVTIPTCQYRELFEFFATTATAKGNTALPINYQDSVKNMAAIDALFASAKSGVWEKVKCY